MSPAAPRWILLATALPAFLAGCAAADDERARPLRIVLTSPPITLDPHLQDEVSTFSVLGHVYEGLTTFDADSRVVPALAARWENPDELTWRFHLRQGVRFHDGRPLTAQDVVTSLERAISHPRSRAAHYLVAVRDVSAADDSTVEIRTARPYPILLHKLAFIMILPQGSAEEIEAPVGTGPYRYVRQWQRDSLALEAHREYWGGAPAEPSVRLRFVPEARTRTALLLGGGADVVVQQATTDAARVDSSDCCRVVSRAGLVVAYLGMRVDTAPFSDVRVREAVSLAIDRAAAVERLFGSRGRALGQLVTPQVFGYATDIEAPVRDLARARALLAQAGHPRGLDVVLEHPPARGDQAALLREQLGEAGIRVTLAERSWTDFTDRRARGEVLFFFAGVSCLSGDASDLFDATLRTRNQERGYGEANFTGYSSRLLDSLAERSEVTFDMARRRLLMEEALRVAARDLPLVPLWTQHRLYGTRRDVEYTPRLSGVTFAHDVRRVGR